MTLESKNIKPKPFIVLFWSIPSVSMLEIYKRKSQLLKQAMLENKAVELIVQNNKTLKFKKIEIEMGKFFGFEVIKGKAKRMLLNLNEIKSVTIIEKIKL